MPVYRWAAFSAIQYVMFAINGFVLGGAYFFLVEALRHAEASVVTPYKYATLIWAILIGMVVWRDSPDLQMLAGAILVVASGLYILHRELRRTL